MVFSDNFFGLSSSYTSLLKKHFSTAPPMMLDVSTVSRKQQRRLLTPKRNLPRNQIAKVLLTLFFRRQKSQRLTGRESSS